MTNNSLHHDSLDVTANLPSLKFESALLGEETKLLPLRYRCSALTFQGCCHVGFFVKCLHDMRNIKPILNNPNIKKVSSTKRYMELSLSKKDNLFIGIIGAGRIGTSLCTILLDHVKIPPEDLKISTRRPEMLKYLSDKGVSCFFDNSKIASSVHVLLICCLPSQFKTVSYDIRGKLSPRTIVYLLTPGYSSYRVKKLLDHENIIYPKYNWNDNFYHNWDVNKSFNECLKDVTIIKQSCPLLKSSDKFVYAEEKLFISWIYGVVNYCTSIGLNSVKTIEGLNFVFMGINNFDELEREDVISIKVNNIICGLEDEEDFPPFDLCEISSRLTFMDQRIETDDSFYETFLQHYCNSFTELRHTLQT